MALWFSSLAHQNNFAAMESLKEAHAREREKLRVNAERQKNRLVNKKHKEILRETKRAYTMANIKAGSVVVGLVLLGGVLVYSQFVTFGSMLLTAGGGGFLGYLARAKQERLFQRDKFLFPGGTPEVDKENGPKKLT
jgi:predicted phage tail protein